MRILALDIGSKRIGVAITDELGITAQGLKTILRKSIKDTIADIKNLTSELNVSEIAIGLPVNMDGTKSKMTCEVIKFVDELKESINIPIKMWDERLTTMEAEKFLISAGISRKKRKDIKDTLAAQLILEGYLAYKKKKNV